MKLGILDGYALNPGDLNWKPLEDLGELSVYEATSTEELIARIQGFEAVFTNKVAFPAEVLQQAPKLRYIGVMATGYDKIDIKAAKEQGITVTNVAGYGTAAVAQHTFALLLELANQVGMHSESVAAGEWDEQAGWCYWKKPIIELEQQVLGIIGMGDIGQKVAQISQAFGMNILYHTPNPKPNMIGEAVSLERLLQESDVVSLHCPLRLATEGLINESRLQMMKPTALLLNTGRGQLIEENALADALARGVIGGAGLDVLSQEPPPSDHPLIQAPNCLITPHNAWASKASRVRLLEEVALNLQAFIKGEARNVLTS